MRPLDASHAAQEHAAAQTARRLDQDTLHQALVSILSGGTDHTTHDGGQS